VLGKPFSLGALGKACWIYGYDVGSIASVILLLKSGFHLSNFDVSIVASATAAAGLRIVSSQANKTSRIMFRPRLE
jgi:hypothetical protein